MAAELGLLSLTQIQELAQSHQQNQHPQNPIVAWMWNPKQAQEDDESWEVRAFEEDTGNILGTTWPPRSYTCTFCRREFRSAQALGGHMNVHRRDRARLHQTQPIASIHHKNSSRNPSSSPGTSAFGIPTQEFSSNGGGFCLLYQFPNPDGIFTAPTTMDSCNHLIGQPVSFPIAPLPANSSQSFSTIAEVEPFNGGGNGVNDSNNNNYKELVGEEEVDLELRLGHRSTTSSSSTSS